MVRALILWLCLGGLCLSAATSAATPPGYAQPPEQGWAFYKDPPKDPEPAPPKMAPPPAPAPLPDEDSALMAMHPKALRALYTAHLEHAVWQPTPEHVANVLRIQNVLRRKAAAFAAVSQYVLLQDNEMNVARAYPATSLGQQARREQVKADIRRTLQANRDRFALLFFTRPGCRFCTAQAGVVKQFQARYGWTVRELDLAQDPHLAVRFGIEYTPTLVLIARGKDSHFPVAVGVEALTTIERNVDRGIRVLSGTLRPEQFFTAGPDLGGVLDPLAGLDTLPVVTNPPAGTAREPDLLEVSR